MKNFNYQPHLSDSSISLRPVSAEDWPLLYAAGCDPAIWGLHPASERWQEVSFRRYFDSCLASAGALVIEDTATREMLGMSRYDRERAEAGEIEIGWTFLVRNRWGGPTNVAVKRLMIEHALASFDRAIFLIGEDNSRSRRALEKIGGKLLSRQYDAQVEGQSVRLVIYAIDRASFATGPLMAFRNAG
jgi:RimJ/RimL family protein N-acetyltransferase